MEKAKQIKAKRELAQELGECLTNLIWTVYELSLQRTCRYLIKKSIGRVFQKLMSVLLEGRQNRICKRGPTMTLKRRGMMNLLQSSPNRTMKSLRRSVINVLHQDLTNGMVQPNARQSIAKFLADQSDSDD
jgi:hypothetical protein